MSQHHVIIGGGPAATNAMETIRRYDTAANITLISDEPAHSRMALPYWLADNIPREQTHTGNEDYFAKLNVQARIGERVSKIDPSNRQLQLASDDTLTFDRLLLATGSRPMELPIPGHDLPGVHHLWTLADTQKVLDATASTDCPEVVMIGAGFIGLIVLNAMHKRGWRLTVVERDHQVLPRMLDRQAAVIAHDWLKRQSVGVHCNASVTEISTSGNASEGSCRKQIRLDNGTTLEADVVIVATGVQPNLDLVQGTGIKTDHGILVDDQQQTNLEGIFAAGDVAQGPVRFKSVKEVHAIQPTAVDHGRVAGANMTGNTVHYPGSLLMNVLDVCGLQCASFGDWGDGNADAMTISNPANSIYRCLRWTGEKITGAVFAGRANDMGMLTDVGMVKGMIQTHADLGTWKQYLKENPFDIRRAFIANKIPLKLSQETLLGQPSAARQYRYQDAKTKHQPGAAHAAYVNTKS